MKKERKNASRVDTFLNYILPYISRLHFLQLFHYDVRIKNNVAGDSELFKSIIKSTRSIIDQDIIIDFSNVVVILPVTAPLLNARH